MSSGDELFALLCSPPSALPSERREQGRGWTRRVLPHLTAPCGVPCHSHGGVGCCGLVLGVLFHPVWHTTGAAKPLKTGSVFGAWERSICRTAGAGNAPGSCVQAGCLGLLFYSRCSTEGSCGVSEPDLAFSQALWDFSSCPSGSCSLVLEIGCSSTPRLATRAFADQINLFPKSIQAWTQSAESRFFVGSGPCQGSRQRFSFWCRCDRSQGVGAFSREHFTFCRAEEGDTNPSSVRSQAGPKRSASPACACRSWGCTVGRSPHSASSPSPSQTCPRWVCPWASA